MSVLKETTKIGRIKLTNNHNKDQYLVSVLCEAQRLFTGECGHFQTGIFHKVKDDFKAFGLRNKELTAVI